MPPRLPFPNAIPAAFGLDVCRQRRDIDLPGSPERCAQRWALEDDTCRIFVLERLRPGQETRREVLARLLRRLSDNGLSKAVAWLPVADPDDPISDSTSYPTGALARDQTGLVEDDQAHTPNQAPSPGSGRPLIGAPWFVLQHSGARWMLSPYVPNHPLPRPGYLDHEARGAALAGFLADLRAASRAMGQSPFSAPLAGLEPLNLPGYARDLARTVQTRRPELTARLAPVLAALDPLFQAWIDLPSALCHGDFHPLNVLWAGPGSTGGIAGDIIGVIDWEFAGPRPELYDAANLMGCCGFEHPRAFASGLVPALLKGLRQRGLLTRDNADRLPLLVLGLRLAWLSEWLRKKDEEMLGLELDYLSLLTAALPDMARAWRV